MRKESMKGEQLHQRLRTSLLNFETAFTDDGTTKKTRCAWLSTWPCLGDLNDAVDRYDMRISFTHSEIQSQINSAIMTLANPDMHDGLDMHIKRIFAQRERRSNVHSATTPLCTPENLCISRSTRP
jgi:hypothetical protein